MFVIVSVIYRPIEQLLSRTIAERRARGLHDGHPLRVAAAASRRRSRSLFLVVALALRGPIQDDVFDGSAALYWVLVGGVARLRGELLRARLAGRPPALRPLRRPRAARVAARASCSRSRSAVGHRRTGRRPSRSASRPRRCVSLVVVPLGAGAASDADADRERGRAGRGRGLTLRHGAASRWRPRRSCSPSRRCSTAPVLIVDATATDAALAGFVFNVLLIARAPLQLFQAIQTSLLPHLAGLEATGGPRGVRAGDPRRRCWRSPPSPARSRSGCCVIGPWVDGRPVRRRTTTTAASGWRSSASAWAATWRPGTLNQAALARGRARTAAAAWLVARRRCSWSGCSPPIVDDELLRVEVGYFGAAALLSVALAVLYRRADARVALPAGAPPRATGSAPAA